MPVFPAEVHKACQVILANAMIVDPTLEFALPYARRALTQTGRELEITADKLLLNLTAWKHHNARTIRDVLRAYRAR
jgi:hypothetical protein